MVETAQDAVWLQERIERFCLRTKTQKPLSEMNTITQTPINIGQIPRVIRFNESVGLITLLVTLSVLAWAKRANAKGMR